MIFNITINRIKSLAMLTIVFVAFACSNNEISSDSIITDDNNTPNEVDIWISENFTQPYNIEVIYKWTDEQTDISKNLVPPERDKVIPFLEVLKSRWIDQYESIAGEDFIRQLTPKQILLIGSPNVNSDGTVTDGTAEGGRKIVLYSVNHFDSANDEEVDRMTHIVHHEFAHIMHQTENYNVEFKTITPEGYTSTWYNVSEEEARNKGFITPYAQLSPNEDFVEMISNFLINSPEEWNAIIDGIENEEAKAALREKEQHVADYLLQVWNIDLYEFQIQMNN